MALDFRWIPSILTAILLTFGGSLQPSWGQDTALESQPASASAEHDPVAQLREDLRYLSGDALTGRGPGTPGIELAAEYIYESFQQAGLHTELVEGKPFQTLTLDLGAEAKSADENYLTVRQGEDPARRLELDQAMRPLAIGASATASGRLVFAGYGITAPELNYDDYQDLDVQGAVVMLIRKTPGSALDDNPFAQRTHSHHAFFGSKVKNAVQRGAVAVLIVNDRDSLTSHQQQLQRRLKGEKQRIQSVEETLENAPEGLEKVRQTLENTKQQAIDQRDRLQQELDQSQAGLLGVDDAGGMAEPAAIPVVSLSRQQADALLTMDSGLGLEELETAYAQSLETRSRVFGDCQIEVHTAITRSEHSTANVIATWPGKGSLANESIVIGAHYDHVGMGGYGSLAPGTIAVHNGADDNASGTVTMMEVARRLPERMEAYASHRRLIFIAFTGEERGLLGSKQYINEPVFPLQDTAAMVNLDMVGRLKDNELTVYGTGTASEFDALLDRVNGEAAFELLRVPSGYGPSDHSSFYQAKVPVLFFFTGLHNDYHRPTDDFDKIDFGGMARITDIVTEVSEVLASGSRPTYQSTEPGAAIRRQLTVFFGIRMQNGPDSVSIVEVYENSPAAQVSLRAGDQITQLEGKPIQHSDHILDALRKKQPGDLLKVEVKRDNVLLNFNVLLAERP